MSKMRWFMVLLVFLMAMPTIARAIPVNVTASGVWSGASESGISGISTDISYETAVPNSDVLFAENGGSSSTTTLDWLSLGDGVILDFEFNHIRAGSANSWAATFISSLYFTATENTIYDLSGIYSLDGEGHINNYVYLYDIDASTFLFANSQRSYNTTDENFVLGQTGGDSNNYLIGNLTGDLTYGHDYELYLAAEISPNDTDDSGASASGSLTLKIGIPVPEPTTMLLLSVGLIGIAGFGRKKISKR